MWRVMIGYLIVYGVPAAAALAVRRAVRKVEKQQPSRVEFSYLDPEENAKGW